MGELEKRPYGFDAPESLRISGARRRVNKLVGPGTALGLGALGGVLTGLYWADTTQERVFAGLLAWLILTALLMSVSVGVQNGLVWLPLEKTATAALRTREFPVNNYRESDEGAKAMFDAVVEFADGTVTYLHFIWEMGRIQWGPGAKRGAEQNFTARFPYASYRNDGARRDWGNLCILALDLSRSERDID
jgi:hypothetical protein